MQPQVPPPPVTDAPVPADASVPIPVLAEGTAPVSIAYRAMPTRVRWPHIAGALALIAAVTALLARRDTSDDARYPLAATASERALLTDGAARWRKGRAPLLAALRSAPDLATLHGVGACSLALPRAATATDDRDTAIALRHQVTAADDAAAIVRPHLDALLRASSRARFASAAGRDHVLGALDRALVVIHVTHQRAPQLDRARDTIVPGVLAGTAYAYAPTGELRCAGELRATTTPPASLSGFAGLDAAQRAADQGLDAAVDDALATSLRAVDL